LTMKESPKDRQN